MSEGMRRTTCNCLLCQAGCKSMPGYLIPQDLEHFDLRDLCRSEGAVVVDRGALIDIPTIVPRQRQDGSCVFYAAGRCMVHTHSPFGCRSFSACATHSPETDRLRDWGLLQIHRDHQTQGPYSQALATLPPARPRTDRKAAFEAALLAAKRRRRTKST